MIFFAVTLSKSMYYFSDRKYRKMPIVRKVALKGKSRVLVGGNLKNGDYIGITGDGICLYIEDHPKNGRIQDPEEVNTAFWGGHTSPIVGLFLLKKDARNCLNSAKLIKTDKRWEKQTRQALEAIAKSIVSKKRQVVVISHLNPIFSDRIS